MICPICGEDVNANDYYDSDECVRTPVGWLTIFVSVNPGEYSSDEVLGEAIVCSDKCAVEAFRRAMMVKH